MDSLTDKLNQKNVEIFVIIKPGFENHSREIVEKFKSCDYEIKQMRVKKLLMSEAKRLYSIHKDEKFYYSLCKYMASGSSIGIIFKRRHPESNRVGGKKDIFEDVKMIKDELRERYGESDMRNVLHSSDSAEHMAKEMSVYF